MRECVWERERVRVASVSVVWIGGLEFSECDGLEDSFGLRCSIFAIKTNKSPNLAPGPGGQYLHDGISLLLNLLKL